MGRIRTIKPEFFLHEGLAELSVETRLCFIGLWTIADREGRFEWRPRKIKVQLFPYDPEVDIESILTSLEHGGFITAYAVNGNEYGAVVNWSRHQIPSRDEPASEIPAPDGSLTIYDRLPNATIRARIYTRDHYRCRYCDRDLRNEHRLICLDHVIPYSKDGTNSEINLATSCKRCNALKGNRTPEEAGYRWPEGLGESYESRLSGGLTPGQRGDNGGSTGGLPVVDGALARKGKGKGNGIREREEKPPHGGGGSDPRACARAREEPPPPPRWGDGQPDAKFLEECQAAFPGHDLMRVLARCTDWYGKRNQTVTRERLLKFLETEYEPLAIVPKGGNSDGPEQRARARILGRLAAGDN